MTPRSAENAENLYNITTRFYYDVRGNQIATKNADGVITRTYYDAANRVVAVVENLGGQAIEAPTVPASGTGGVNILTEYKYDDAGNQIAIIDQHNVVTRTYYDQANRPVTVIRNLSGQGYSVTNPDGVSYNPAFPDQNVRTDTVYDANGNVIATKDTTGVVTRTYYDALNRPKTTLQNLVGQAIEIATPPAVCGAVDQNLCTDTFYDAGGNVIATQDPLGIVTRTYYDSLNRPYMTVQNLVGYDIYNDTPPECAVPGSGDTNLCTSTIYDEAGRAIATRDPLGHVTRTYYDEAGRAYATVRNLTADVEIDQPPAREAGNPDENIRTDTLYDSNGRQVLSIDPLGRQTQYEYDILGRQWKTTANFDPAHAQNYQDPATGSTYNLVTTFTFDALGRTLTSTDTLGHVNAGIYTATGNLSSSTQNVPAGGGCTGGSETRPDCNITTAYSYDDAGRQIAVTDSKNVVTRSYFDALGRTTHVARNLTNWNIANDFPPPGQASTVDNLLSATVYGQNGQVAKTIDENGKASEYGYDALGRRTSVCTGGSETRPCDITTHSTYDAGGPPRDQHRCRRHRHPLRVRRAGPPGRRGRELSAWRTGRP